ncbi:ARL14 effector protein-like [Lycorma delicatula]|uniref:ARL14 effector protein-like n=1 Tax=Lycorma delicatula TaxID=130591 RepID=UPI003F51264A
MSEVLGPCHKSLTFNYGKAFMLLVKELSAMDKELLQRQSGISFNEDADIYSYHKAVLLTKFKFLQKGCCNPIGKELHKARKGLQPIDIDSADRLKALTNYDFKPGQKLWP